MEVMVGGFWECRYGSQGTDKLLGRTKDSTSNCGKLAFQKDIDTSLVANLASKNERSVAMDDPFSRSAATDGFEIAPISVRSNTHFEFKPARPTCGALVSVRHFTIGREDSHSVLRPMGLFKQSKP